MKIKNRTKQTRMGFTLTEVMVALFLFSIFVPSILMMQQLITRLAYAGINRNMAMADARILRQRFVRTVNNSGRNLQIQSSPTGDKVKLEVQDASGVWTNAYLNYNAVLNQIDYVYPDGTKRIFAENVYRVGTNSVFTMEKSGLVCRLFIGKTPPDQMVMSSRFIKPGVYVKLFATPHNRGKEGL
jgi:prepilin-type N-terminal cleavage/methylation domain-containing protein